MAVTRQGNFLGQQRVDVPDLRSIESAIANDFDLLAGIIMTAKESVVVAGFTIDTSSAFGAPATSLILRTAGGVLIHWGATEAGSMIQVPDDQADEILNTSNTRVSGSFASSAMNYIGIDYLRSADATTSDTTKFMTADTGQEVARSVPKARTLDYRITISTSPFSLTPNVDPIAKVLTDSSGNVVSVTDARNLLGRLAPGGDVPNPFGSYTWDDATRRENNNTYAPPTTTDNPFEGGDKGIHSLKDWMDAIMNTLWEAKSGQYWYSPTTRDGIKLGCSSNVIVATGDNFDWTTPPTLKWQGLVVSFENSTVNNNTIVDNASTGVTILDGQCLYVDIDRTQVAALVAQVGTLTSLPAPTVPGSRVIIAWRVGSDLFIRDRGFNITRTVPVATTTTSGIVRLNATPAAPSAPVVISIQANGTASVTATAGGAAGFTGTGHTSGYGLVGMGGTSGGGVYGQGTSFLDGVTGIGGPTGGAGVNGTGGATGGAGVVGTGGTTNGNGVYGQGTGTANGVQGVGGPTGGAGVTGTGGTTNGNGVYGQGTGTANGVQGVGGATSGIGVIGTGGAPNGIGVRGVGTGTGAGGSFQGGATGMGVVAQGGATSGFGGSFTGGGGASGHGISAAGGGAGSAGIIALGGQAGYGGNFTGGLVSGIGVRGAGTLTGVGGEFVGGATNAAGLTATGGGTGAGGIFDGAGSGTAASDDAIVSNQNIRFAGSNPASTQAFTNRLTPMNVPKAWGYITNSGGSATVSAGFSVNTVGYGAGGRQSVTLAQAMSSSNYCVIASSGGVGGGLTLYVDITGPSTFDLIAYDSSGALWNLGSGNNHVHFVVFGAN